MSVSPPLPAAAVEAASHPVAQSDASAVHSSWTKPRALTADEVQAGTVGVIVAPRDAGVTDSSSVVTIDVEVVNRTSEAITAGEITLTAADQPVRTRYELKQWLLGNDGGVETSVDIGTLTGIDAEPGQSTVATFTIPRDELPGTFDDPVAARAITATLNVSGNEIASARSVIARTQGEQFAQTRISAIVPIVPPLTTRGVIPKRELEELTAPEGTLTTLLDAVEGTNATLAVDPRLPLSIRVLEDTAPGEATAWLKRLESMPNLTYTLPYADVDLALIRELGLSAHLPDAGTLSSDTNPDDQTPTATASATAQPGDTQTESPGESEDTGESGDDDQRDADPEAEAESEHESESEVDPSETPTPTHTHTSESAAALMSIANSRGTLIWPAAGSTSGEALKQIIASSASPNTVIVNDASVDAEELPWTPDARITVDGIQAQQSDSELSLAIRDAVGANSDREWNAAAARLTATLAVTAGELPEVSRELVVTTPRTAPADPAMLQRALALIENLAITELIPLNTAGREGLDEREGTLVEAAADPDSPAAQFHADQLRIATQLVRDEQRAFEYSSMFEKPARFRARTHASLLATLGAGWRDNPAGWTKAANGFHEYVLATELSVALSPASEIQVVGSEVQLPVFVENNGSEPVTVRVSIRPNTGIIETGEPQMVTVEPGSMQRAFLDVSAIANGVTTATVHLETPDGVRISEPQTLTVNVRAEWEAVGIGVIIAMIGLLFIAGIVRTIKRRRRGDADPDEGAGSASGIDDEPASAQDRSDKDSEPAAWAHSRNE